MQKKKQGIIIRCNDKDLLNKYLDPDYNKIVVINVYDKYWGSCEVVEMITKRFLETRNNATKADFFCY